MFGKFETSRQAYLAAKKLEKAKLTEAVEFMREYVDAHARLKYWWIDVFDRTGVTYGDLLDKTQDECGCNLNRRTAMYDVLNTIEIAGLKSEDVRVAMSTCIDKTCPVYLETIDFWNEKYAVYLHVLGKPLPAGSDAREDVERFMQEICRYCMARPYNHCAMRADVEVKRCMHSNQQSISIIEARKKEEEGRRLQWGV